ncbi:MAG TPA: DoxX family protein [Flavipsychrobacter sp.]|nr:DoxX family protein [Flavipsychrobacter sp.]
MTTTNKTHSFYWMATIIAAIAFIIPGVLNLIHSPHIAQDMAHLGYPAYFLNLLGTWKILGAITILIPGFKRLKEWAYAGMTFDLSGAAVSRFSSGDNVLMAIIPLLIVSIVITSWALRPENRILR